MNLREKKCNLHYIKSLLLPVLMIYRRTEGDTYHSHLLLFTFFRSLHKKFPNFVLCFNVLVELFKFYSLGEGKKGNLLPFSNSSTS